MSASCQLSGSWRQAVLTTRRCHVPQWYSSQYRCSKTRRCYDKLKHSSWLKKQKKYQWEEPRLASDLSKAKAFLIVTLKCPLAWDPAHLQVLLSKPQPLNVAFLRCFAYSLGCLTLTRVEGDEIRGHSSGPRFVHNKNPFALSLAQQVHLFLPLCWCLCHCQQIVCFWWL